MLTKETIIMFVYDVFYRNSLCSEEKCQWKCVFVLLNEN